MNVIELPIDEPGYTLHQSTAEDDSLSREILFLAL
jgi:hypothetical protein